MPPKSVTAALLVVTGVAAALRLWGLGDAALWIDEAASVWLATPGGWATVQRCATDAGPPGFYLLLHPWMALFGQSEWALRSLPALLGIATTGVVFVLARSMRASPPVALLAALIHATHPLSVYYARQVRAYTLAPLLAGLALWLSMRALRRRHAVGFVPVAVVMALGAYVHTFFVFLLPAVPLLAAATSRLGSEEARGATTGRTFGWALLAVSAAFAAYAPWLPTLFAQGASGAAAWIEPLWAQTSFALPRSMEVMGVGGAYPTWLRELATATPEILSEPGALALRGLGIVLLVAAVGASLRTPAVPLWIAVWVPLIVAFGMSWLLRPTYLVGRYEIVVMPALAVLVASGLAHLPRRIVPIGLWLVASIGTSLAYLSAPAPTFERTVAQTIAEQSGAGDLVVATDFTWAVQRYYADRLGAEADLVSWPAEVSEHPGWYDVRATLRSGTLHAAARDLSTRARDVIRRGGRVLIVDYNRAGDLSAANRPLHAALVRTLGPPGDIRATDQGPWLVRWGP